MDSTEKLSLFKKAMKKQIKVLKGNIFGEGLDIPLLGIRVCVCNLVTQAFSVPLAIFCGH